MPAGKWLARLPTLNDLQRTRRPAAKGQTLFELMAARVRAKARRETEFRNAVWARDDHRCRLCGRRVRRTLTRCPEQGHVHHLRGRRVAPEDLYNPAAALLVCAVCHQAHHDGEVRVTP